MALSETWFLEGYIDFELQKYRLLSYLNEVKQHFKEVKLYPYLSDLITHYNSLTEFRNNKRFLQDQFPKQMEGISKHQLELLYKQMLEDDALMEELESIAEYSAHQMKQAIDDGAGIYDFVEHHTRIEPIGILPVYKNEGYVFLSQASISSIHIYSYTITLFEHKEAKYKGVRMVYVDSKRKSIINTYEQVKREVITTLRMLPNPAVFCIESDIHTPIDETLLPIAKRMLVRQIHQYSA